MNRMQRDIAPWRARRGNRAGRRAGGTLLAVALVLSAAACGDDGMTADANVPTPDAGGVDAGGDAAAVDAALIDADPAQATYAARALIGALDRILITKADPVLDICVMVRLVSPAGIGKLGITLPANWDTEFAFAYPGAADCHTFTEFPQNPVYALAGSGAIDWTVAGGEIYPTEITSVDVTLTFPANQQPIPETVRMAAGNLPVSAF